jgi:hypothetical protein
MAKELARVVGIVAIVALLAVAAVAQHEGPGGHDMNKAAPSPDPGGNGGGNASQVDEQPNPGQAQAQDEEDKPAWQRDIDWAATDTGAPDCPELYVGPEAICLGGGLVTGNNFGNRACVISMAQGFAEDHLDYAAYGLVLLTQCHNPAEHGNLMDAGAGAVAAYLRDGQ